MDSGEDFGLENNTNINSPCGNTCQRHVFLVLTWEVCALGALQAIFHFCIPKKDLAKPHFSYQLHISRTELYFFCLEL
jgi:hypothetical protein